MAEDMVERVKGVLRAEVERRASAGHGNGYAADGDDGLIVDTTLDLESLARAAIEAMREPTEAMLRKGATWGTLEMDGKLGRDFTRLWQAMIDAVLP